MNECKPLEGGNDSETDSDASPEDERFEAGAYTRPQLSST